MSVQIKEACMTAESGVEFREWSVGDSLRHAVAAVPDRTALICPARPNETVERRWTYQELHDDAERVAFALLSRFTAGDRVATWAGASAEIVILQLGAALAGIVLVTLNPANRAVELGYLLSQSEVRGIFLDRVYRKMENVPVLERLRADLPHLEHVIYLDAWKEFIAQSVVAARTAALPASVSPAAPAMIVFTSGTTGKPKGVVLRHCGIVNNARLSTARIELEPGATWLNVLPMFHIGGSVTMLLGCFANLGTLVLLPEFTADAMLDTLQRYGVTVTMAVPTMLHAMFESERFATTDWSALQVIVMGGTAIAPELVREVKQRCGVDVMVMFGQTEAGGSMCLTRRTDPEQRITATVGAPLPLSEVKILLPGGGIADLNQIGEICVRTRCAMIEYFRMPERTAETLDADGWVHTGDLGTMDADGYIKVTGRLKDMIIRGGENIYPREIEDMLAEHPAVAQAAVYGVADLKWGEQIGAAVILKSGAQTDVDALMRYLQERIARHKVPKFWQFLAAFPVNSSGKIQKFKLRESHENRE